MKQIIFSLLFMLFALTSITAQTSNVKSTRDSLAADPTFRSLVSDVMYGIAIDVVADTSAYAISTRPAFDRLLTDPDSDYFTDMFVKAVLNHPSIFIDVNGEQTIEQQLEYALRTMTLWKSPINAFIRQKNGVYAFPYDLSGFEGQISEIDGAQTTLASDLNAAEATITSLQTTITALEVRIETLETAGQE